MFNVLEGECTSAKDLGKARMRQDAKDVAKLEAQFTKYEVFRCTSDLVVVTTGDVASNAIKQALGKLVRKSGKSSKSSLKPG